MSAESEGPQYETVRTEIPRHKRWGGPLVMPANHRCTPGSRVCDKCGRSWKGRCSCTYYKRCTNYIDVLQNEYALKQWDRRLVAYGMGQRPDLILAASACKPPAMGDVELTSEDKAQLQAIADQAKDHAKGRAAATVGTSLHKLTQLMDEGQTLDYVPEPYPADLRAYQKATKDIQFVDIESFRVHDELKVGGTADRFGWVKGRLRVLDIKTGSIWWEGTPAMQLAMYARSVKYDIASDTRVADVAEIDLNVGYVIHLPQGTGTCRLIPVDIAKGWAACRTAELVWKARDEKHFFLDEDRVPSGGTFGDMAARAGTVKECQMLWRNARDQDQLTDQLKATLLARVEVLQKKSSTNKNGE